MSHFKIPAEHSAPIIADQQQQAETIRTAVSELGGADVLRLSVSGSLTFGLAHIVAVEFSKQPTGDGWQPSRRHDGCHTSNRRRKAGRELQGKLNSFDLLGLHSSLKRAGISPWPHTPKGSFPVGVCGHRVKDGVIYLEAGAAWKFDWPEYVTEIMGSEYPSPEADE